MCPICFGLFRSMSFGAIPVSTVFSSALFCAKQIKGQNVRLSIQVSTESEPSDEGLWTSHQFIWGY